MHQEKIEQRERLARNDVVTQPRIAKRRLVLIENIRGSSNRRSGRAGRGADVGHAGISNVKSEGIQPSRASPFCEPHAILPDSPNSFKNPSKYPLATRGETHNPLRPLEISRPTPLISQRTSASREERCQLETERPKNLKGTPRGVGPEGHASVPMRPRSFMGDGLRHFSQFSFGPVHRVRWARCNGFISSSTDCLADKGFSFSEVRLAAEVVVHLYNLHATPGRAS